MINKKAFTFGSTGNQELDWMNNKIQEISQRPEEVAKSEALAEHFSKPETYRDMIHDANTFGTNVIRKTPGLIPNFLGSIYGWLWDKPDNQMSRFGKWVDKNIGDPLASLNIGSQAIDAATSEPGTRKPGLYQMPDGQYSSELKKADPLNFMGFMEDLGSGAIVTGGVSAASKIPAVSKFVTPTLKAPVKFFKAWNNLGKKAQNILPAAFNKTIYAANMNPAKAQAITKGLGILNKGAYKTLTWGAPAIDAIHNFGTKNSRYDSNYSAPLATSGYALKLTSPYQMILNGVSSIPKIEQGIHSIGSILYNKTLDKPVGDTAERIGKGVGDQIVEDAKNMDIKGIPDITKIGDNLAHYIDKAVDGAGPLAKYVKNAAINAAVNAEEGQFNTSSVRRKLPKWLRQTPIVKLLKGSASAAGAKADTYLERAEQGLVESLLRGGFTKEDLEKFIDRETGKLRWDELIEHYRIDPRWVDYMVSDYLNKEKPPYLDKVPEKYKTPENVATTRNILSLIGEAAAKSAAAKKMSRQSQEGSSE